jgi:3'(2'), 5'-bisphosphate nucleotidase
MRADPGPMPASLDKLLGCALRAAGLAGREILEVYATAFAVDAKRDRSPITEADRRAHRALERSLGQAGGLPVLSEEGGRPEYRFRRRWRLFWLVDPLDGTKEFVKHNGEFTVNIALIGRRRPLLGVVYAPELELLYFGYRPGGSFKAEGVAAEELAAGIRPGSVRLPPRPSSFPGRIPVRPQDGRLTVMRSRSHHSARLERLLERLRRVYAEVEEIPLGAALKACTVAEGRADLYLRFGTTMEWDTAAGQAVVEGVGRRVCAYASRRPLLYNKRNLVNPAFLVY